MSLDDRMRNFSLSTPFRHKKPPHRYAVGGSVLLRKFFFYFFERHLERMPA